VAHNTGRDAAEQFGSRARKGSVEASRACAAGTSSSNNERFALDITSQQSGLFQFGLTIFTGKVNVRSRPSVTDLT